MQIDLTGKIVLVTGAGRGIGESITRHLTEANATVAMHYNHSHSSLDSLAESRTNNSQSFQADLSDRLAIPKLIKKIIHTYGRIDVLINNAGTAVHSDPASDTGKWLEEWDHTMAINLTAPALLIKEVLPIFLDHQEGMIINISSRAAFRGDTKDYLAYAASKGGMESLTKSLARAYGKSGIVAYGIAPGFTRTEMAEKFIKKYGEQYALDDISLNDLTTPDDIAPMVVFLASGHAKHATGTTIDINAGSYVR